MRKITGSKWQDVSESLWDAFRKKAIDNKQKMYEAKEEAIKLYLKSKGA
jgi:hypothetical protein